MNNENLKLLNTAIKEWSADNKAKISLNSYKKEIDLFKKITNKKEVNNLLEVGSGSGLYSLYLVISNFTNKATGIDPDFLENNDIQKSYNIEDLIQKLNLKNKTNFNSDTFETFLSKERKEKYDLIYFRQSLHHIYEKDNKKGEDNNIIKDFISLKTFFESNGHICIMEISRPNFLYKYLYNLYRTIKGTGKMSWTDKKTKKEWVKILKQSGFKDIKSKKIPLNLFTSHKLLNKLKIGKILSCSFLIVASNK